MSRAQREVRVEEILGVLGVVYHLTLLVLAVVLVAVVLRWPSETLAAVDTVGRFVTEKMGMGR